MIKVGAAYSQRIKKLFKLFESWSKGYVKGKTFCEDFRNHLNETILVCFASVFEINKLSHTGIKETF